MLDCYAITIDDVRDIFRADEQLSAELTAAASSAFPSHSRRSRGFWPLIRQSPTRVDPARPTTEDLTTMLSGGFIPPERMAASWELFRVLLAHRATEHLTIDIAARELDEAEFDLSRHGLDSHFSIRRLGERPLGIPLRAPAGRVCGYAKLVHVAETAAALRAVLEADDEESPIEASTREAADPLLGLCERAAEKGLDLVVLES